MGRQEDHPSSFLEIFYIKARFVVGRVALIEACNITQRSYIEARSLMSGAC